MLVSPITIALYAHREFFRRPSDNNRARIERQHKDVNELSKLLAFNMVPAVAKYSRVDFEGNLCTLRNIKSK